MNKYKCKICGKEFGDDATVVSSSALGVMYKCNNCTSGNVWGFVSKR